MSIFTQNTKMRKSGIIGFGLPPGMTCVKCSCPCYAVKGAYAAYQRQCMAHWDSNLALTQSPEFVFVMHRELLGKKAKYVRIHTEGDFYSQEYLDNWMAIARLFPDKQFYTYTKALHLDWSNLPNNFKRIQSIGGEHDSLLDMRQPHARIFKDGQQVRQFMYLDCSNDDLLAANPLTLHIGLIEH